LTEGTRDDWQLIGDELERFAKKLPERLIAHLQLLRSDYGGLTGRRLTFRADAEARFAFLFAKASSRNSSASWTFERHQSRMSFEKRFCHFRGVGWLRLLISQKP
jgi:hypothetical protein